VSSDARRQLVATGMIGIAVCIGGSVALVGPAKKQLAAARARAETLSVQLREAESARDGMAQYTTALARVRSEAKTISDAGAMARDERQLFSAVMASAAAHQIRIDQLNPAKVVAATPAPVPPGTPGAAPLPSDKDIAVGYSMTAIGSYGDIAAFLRALRSEFGFSTVRSVRMVPTGDDQRQTVRALIETTHWSFDPNPATPEDAARLSQAGGQ
jgi:hypothetical protein